MRSPQIVLGEEVELDFAPNGKTAAVYAYGNQSIGNVSQGQNDQEWYSSLKPDTLDTLQNQLENLVRYARRMEAYKAACEVAQ